jgi:hypothetical protein
VQRGRQVRDIRTSPEVGSRSPSIVSIAVDLPAPFGPSSATVSPGWMSKDTWSSALISGWYTLTTSRKATAGPVAPLLFVIMLPR